MPRLLLLFLFMFISIWSDVLSDSPTTDYPNETVQIINGEDAPEGRWPFMVSLQSNDGHHFCGGSILNDDSILTAAHCVLAPTKVSDTKAFIGSVNNKNPDLKSLYQAKQFMANPKFSIDKLAAGNDVAVIKLDRKIDFKQLKGKVSKICLPDSSDEPLTDKCIALGWGLTKADGGSTPATLKQVDLPIMPDGSCTTSKYDPKVIYCAGFKGGNKATCSGDSGSPVVCPSKSDSKKYLQYGITSYGNVGCNSFGYYTKAAAFLDFIREKAES